MNISDFNEELFEKYLKDIEPPYGDFIKRMEDNIEEASKEARDFDDNFSAPKQLTVKIITGKFKHPASLNFAMRAQFGSEWIDWEPETIEKTINDDLGVKLDDFDKNMIGALKTLFKTSRFFSDYRVFGWTVYAFNQQIPRMNIIPKPHAGMLLDTYASTPKIRSGIYRSEIRKYVQEELKEYGVKPIPGLIMGDNETDEANSNLKAYLKTENKEKIDEILDYLQEENKQYILKTIGMIDYYMARLNMANSQINKLRE